VVLMLGGVAEPKGAVVLIRALPELLKQVPNARIVIAGPDLGADQTGGIKGIAKRILNTEGYQREVRDALADIPVDAMTFTGIRQDMPELIAASNVLVFPSVVAHFARPIIEAAAMGVPSVASDLGGPRELIVDQQTGLLVKAGNPQVLANALGRLLTDRALARSMGEAAYNRARTLFEAGYNAAATIAVYDELLIN
jgi:glycosyltransferase involved in cell wall biosynthesis